MAGNKSIWSWIRKAVAILGLLVVAATASAQHVHPASTDAVIDGAAHPELVTDNAAYRLFFLYLTDPKTDDSHQQNVLTRYAKLNSTEASTAKQILADFRAKYDALLNTYNTAAIAASQHNAEAPEALKTFLTGRDRLVESTRIQLLLNLSNNGFSGLNTHIQHEKTRMKIAVE